MEMRYKATCIDDGGTINLEVGDQCYITDPKKSHVYCYRSDSNKKSHFAMLPSGLFQISEQIVNHRETDTGQLAFF